MTSHQRDYRYFINASLYMMLLRRMGVKKPTMNNVAMADAMEGR